MDWSKTTNIILILLLILNVFLRVVVVLENKKTYTIGEERIENIKNIANKNNVKLNFDSFTEYYPMKCIELSKMELDSKKVLDKFFGKEAELNTLIRENRRIYYIKDSEYAEIYRNGLVKYVSQFDTPLSSGEDLKKLENKFYQRIYVKNKNYELNKYVINDDVSVYIYYRTTGKRYYLLNDYIKILVYNDRIEAESWQFNVLGYKEKGKEIIPYDEILYHFIRLMSSALDEMEIVYFKLGYYTVNNDLLLNNTVTIEPYYLIILSDGTEFYINAFTNELYDKNLWLIDV